MVAGQQHTVGEVAPAIFSYSYLLAAGVCHAVLQQNHLFPLLDIAELDKMHVDLVNGHPEPFVVNLVVVDQDLNTKNRQATHYPDLYYDGLSTVQWSFNL